MIPHAPDTLPPGSATARPACSAALFPAGAAQALLTWRICPGALRARIRVLDRAGDTIFQQDIHCDPVHVQSGWFLLENVENTLSATLTIHFDDAPPLERHALLDSSGAHLTHPRRRLRQITVQDSVRAIPAGLDTATGTFPLSSLRPPASGQHARSAQKRTSKP